MSLLLREGDRFEAKGRTLRITRLDVALGPGARACLIEIAKQRGLVTYGEFKEAAGLPHAVNGIGRLLDVLSEDCRVRGEPSLAPIVINASTNEVGSDYQGHSELDRTALYDYWQA